MVGATLDVTNKNCTVNSVTGIDIYLSTYDYFSWHFLVQSKQ